MVHQYPDTDGTFASLKVFGWSKIVDENTDLLRVSLSFADTACLLFVSYLII